MLSSKLFYYLLKMLAVSLIERNSLKQAIYFNCSSLKILAAERSSLEIRSAQPPPTPSWPSGQRVSKCSMLKWPTSFKDLKMQGWLTSLKMQNSIGKGQQMWQRWSESVGPEQKHMETCVVCQNMVAEVVRRHEGPSPKSLDSDENFKP